VNSASRRGIRDRFNAFIDRHDIAWELTMALLAIVYVAVGFALDDPALQPMAPSLEAAEVALTIVFAAEFASRIAASRNRGGYLRSHWIDLVALVPASRALRILRMLRLLRLVRAFAGVYRALGHVGSLAQHRGLQTIVLSWLGVMVICCTAIYFAERDVIGTEIRSPFDALWWGISTMTTVGYGDVVPQTAEGRIAASALMLLGIGLFSAVTAIITSFLVAGREAKTDPITSLERLGVLAASGAISSAEFAAKRTDLLARV
jgi:voltage-gated potassium channel